MELDAVQATHQTVSRRKEIAKNLILEPAVGNAAEPPPEEIVAELKDKLSQAKMRQTAISSERRAVALAAHMGSANDRARLDQLNQEGAVLSGEIEGHKRTHKPVLPMPRLTRQSRQSAKRG